MIRIFTSLYPEADKARAAEIRECLQRNLELVAIDEVCLILEKDMASTHTSEKLHTNAVGHRPTYHDFFDWANTRIQSDEDITVVCNSDIYFDSSLQILRQSMRLGHCAALSRWDIDSDGARRLFDRNDSQDAWVFRGRIRSISSDYLMGVPRCDNHMLYELKAAGYEVINPAFSVRAMHLHEGERGEYPGEIDGPHVGPPYAYLWPHNLMSLPGTLWHRWRHPESAVGWRFDWRKLQQTAPWRIVRKLKTLAAENRNS